MEKKKATLDLAEGVVALPVDKAFVAISKNSQFFLPISFLFVTKMLPYVHAMDRQSGWKEAKR